MPVEKLLGGVSKFKIRYTRSTRIYSKASLPDNGRSAVRDLFRFAIDPCLLTQTKPVNCSYCRVIGNIVPPFPDAIGGVSATVEFAVGVLRVPEVIVCGHTDCGVVRGALQPHNYQIPQRGALAGIRQYLSSGRRAKSRTPPHIEREQCRGAAAKPAHTPTVAARLKEGNLGLHGWIYHIATGAVTVYDPEVRKFLQPVHANE